MGDIISFPICLHNHRISIKKKLRYLIIISSILNLFLVCGFTGFAYSDPILSNSSLNSTSFQDELLIGHLIFTSNGGNLEAAIVEMNNKYETQIIYTELDTGKPILGADIRIHGDTDKANTYSDERSFGIYTIEITPIDTGRLSFEIEALKSGYSINNVRLVLSVGLIPSELLFRSNNLSTETGEVEINSTYTTDVKFTNSSNPINNASIKLVNYFSDMKYTIISVGDGVYSISLSLSEVRPANYIGIEASAVDIATSSVDLILSTTPILTELRFTATNKSIETGSVEINKTYSTIVQYLRMGDLPDIVPIDNASIEITTDNLAYWKYESLGTSAYRINITVTELPPTDRLTITVYASKSDYFTTFARLSLFIELIPTNLMIDDPDFVNNRLTVTYTDPIEITFRFQDEQKHPIIWNDNITIDGAGLIFNSEVDLALGEELGQYILNLNASSPGIYYPKIYAIAKGHETAVLNIIVIVNRLPMNIYAPSEPDTPKTLIIKSIFEDDIVNMTLTLRDPRFDSLIDGATINYSLEADNVTGFLIELSNGFYVTDLSEKDLGIGTHTFHITVIKEHYETIYFDYSIIIKPKPPSEIQLFVSTYWFYLLNVVIIFTGLLGIWLRKRHFRQKQREMFEDKMSFAFEYISDIMSFQDLLIVSSDANMIYGFNASSFEETSEISLDSAFLMALKTFSGESMMLDELKGEDHFRFGDSEILLISGDLGIFAFLFKAQIIGEEWKRISSDLRDMCRDVVTAIENEFYTDLQNYLISNDSDAIPKTQVTRRVSEILKLDVGLPHELTGKQIEFETYYSDKNKILKVIQQLVYEKGAITVTLLLERLVDLGIPTNEAVYIFYQLLMQEMISPK